MREKRPCRRGWRLNNRVTLRRNPSSPIGNRRSRIPDADAAPAGRAGLRTRPIRASLIGAFLFQARLSFPVGNRYPNLAARQCESVSPFLSRLLPAM